MASSLGTLHYFDHNLQVHRVVVGPYANNVFVVRCLHTGEAVLIDAANEHEKLLELCTALGVTKVLETHGHHDHVGAAADLCGDDLPFVIHEADALALTDPTAWGAGYDVGPQDVKDLRTVADGDVLRFAGFTIHVLHTPGHTPGQIRFDLESRGKRAIFAGSFSRVCSSRKTSRLASAAAHPSWFAV